MSLLNRTALIVDDDAAIRRAVKVGLEQRGYRVVEAADGEQGLDQAALTTPDVIILDLVMPGLDGLTVCRRLREWTTAPIVMLSVHDDEDDKVAALDLGADDYLTKPFSLKELLARLRAVLRRTESEGGQEEPTIEVGGLAIDFADRTVTRDGEELHLTPTEYELLRVLVRHRGRVFTHRMLLTRVWGEAYADDTHTLRVHIANLRRKLEPDSARPSLIVTEPRVGYRFRT